MRAVGPAGPQPEDAEVLVAKAEVAEQAYLRNGFSHPDVVEFGVSGISIGCASWSGVVYLPLSPIGRCSRRSS